MNVDSRTGILFKHLKKRSIFFNLRRSNLQYFLRFFIKNDETVCFTCCTFNEKPNEKPSNLTVSRGQKLTCRKTDRQTGRTDRQTDTGAIRKTNASKDPCRLPTLFQESTGVSGSPLGCFSYCFSIVPFKT